MLVSLIVGLSLAASSPSSSAPTSSSPPQGEERTLSEAAVVNLDALGDGAKTCAAVETPGAILAVGGAFVAGYGWLLVYSASEGGGPPAPESTPLILGGLAALIAGAAVVAFATPVAVAFAMFRSVGPEASTWRFVVAAAIGAACGATGLAAVVMPYACFLPLCAGPLTLVAAAALGALALPTAPRGRDGPRPAPPDGDDDDLGPPPPPGLLRPGAAATTTMQY